MDRDPYLPEQARLEQERSRRAAESQRQMEAAWAADMKWLKEMPARVEAEVAAEAKKQRRLEQQNRLAEAFGLPVGMMWLGMLLLAPLVVLIGVFFA